MTRLPATLYIRQYIGLDQGPTYLAMERLSDFENLKDQEIGVYRLEQRERLTISGKPGKAEAKAG